MKPDNLAAALVLLLLGCTSRDNRDSEIWADPAAHESGFLTANGIRLNYLDWGGKGPVLILIPGFGDNPHVFDDLAPAFTDSYRVIAYARRGHGLSDSTGPFNGSTLTEDLRGLMDGLNISRAHLAGYSMGGNEITEMAGTYPDRVDHIIYLEGAYDFGDPLFVEAARSVAPIIFNPPASAKTSLDAWRSFNKSTFFPSVSDTNRYEAYVRESVIVQPDGSVRLRMSDSVTQASARMLFTTRRDYRRVLSPALAIYAETMFDIRNGDSAWCATNLAWEHKYMVAFRRASIERIRKELPQVEIVGVPGTHMDLAFSSRQQVVDAMRTFLSNQYPKFH